MEKESKKNTNNSATIKRTHWVYSGILFLIFFFSYQYIFDKKLDLGGDNAGYYILGKALSSGEGYTNIHFPDNPAHNHFPPGYPVIIALFMLVSNSIIFIKIVNGVFLLGSALMMYKMLYKVSQNTKLAFVTSALMLLNMHLLYYSRIMMSEIPFLFF